MATARLPYASVANERPVHHLSSNWNDQRGDLAAGSIMPKHLGVASGKHNVTVPSQVANDLTLDTAERRSENDDTNQSTVVDVPRLFRTSRVSGRSVNTLQEWEGLITEVDGEEVHARLRDLTSGTSAEEFATIPLQEFDPNDLDRLEPGTIFHLIIGFTMRGGGRRRETFIYVRRWLPKAHTTVSRLLSLLDETSGDID